MTHNFPLFNYQEEALSALIAHENEPRCIVKMFCGSGKSIIIQRLIMHHNDDLCAIVFPSLCLISQFHQDYLVHLTTNLLVVSSEISKNTPSTTNATTISEFLKKEGQKIVLVTYQSFDVLLGAVHNSHMTIQRCYMDEAHHAVGSQAQTLIWGTDDNGNLTTTNNPLLEKIVFFTATPKNANGIVMYDSDVPHKNMCGPLAYEYTYYRGFLENRLQNFEIRVDLYSENTNFSIYESIARAILVTGNSRVLTFHAAVSDTDNSNTNVQNFVNEIQFKIAFEKVAREEFPEKVNKYKKITMIGLSAAIKMSERDKILKKFDASSDKHVFVLSSCETIGEGVDTKNGNMCVFVDAKSSYVKIIQNIGRVVRKRDVETPSTILIPCWVDKTKYLDCDTDEKRDEVIRNDMNKGGNFSGILNVLSALKCEDEELYDACLRYPDVLSELEREIHYKNEGCVLGECGDLCDVLEEVGLDIDEDVFEECEDDEEMLERIADENNVCIEVHGNEREGTVKSYGGDFKESEDDESDCNGKERRVVSLYKCEKDEEDCDKYCSIAFKENKRNCDKKSETTHRVSAPNGNKHAAKIVTHSNPDIKVLWKIASDYVLDKNIVSCCIESEVVKCNPMEIARGIVERAKERKRNGLNLLPVRTKIDAQQKKDGEKLQDWKKALNGKGTTKCYNNVKILLDNELPQWNHDLEQFAIINATEIIKRAKERESKGLNLLPLESKKDIQQKKDVHKLKGWKLALNGKNKTKCYDSVKLLLNKELPQWSQNQEQYAITSATEIIERAKKRETNGLNLLPIDSKNNIQQKKDAAKLRYWKQALNRKKNLKKCYDSVKTLLDKELPQWSQNQDLEQSAITSATEIIERAKKRETNGLNLLPSQSPNDTQQQKDAMKLNNWKQALNGKGHLKCYDSIKTLLDKELPRWSQNQDLEQIAITSATEIIKRAKERETNGLNLLPIDSKNDIQQKKDAQKLQTWKQALKNGKVTTKCYNSVKLLLDKELPQWSQNQDLEQIAITSATEIIKRAKERETQGLNLLPVISKNDVQQKKDAEKLNNWKQALNGKGHLKCYDSVKMLLDKELPFWSENQKNKNSKQTTASKPSATTTPPLIPQLPETPQQKHVRVKSELTNLHNRYLKLSSKNMHQEFTSNPQLWQEYHNIRTQTEETKNTYDIPRNIIAEMLRNFKTKRTLNVADLGCGLAQISAQLANDSRFTFHNFDHCATAAEASLFADVTVTSAQPNVANLISTTLPKIISADISQLPLENATIDVAILCLASWGTDEDLNNNLKEIKRILDDNGRLIICEPTARWTPVWENTYTLNANKIGEQLQNLLVNNGFKITSNGETGIANNVISTANEVKKYVLYTCYV